MIRVIDLGLLRERWWLGQTFAHAFEKHVQEVKLPRFEQARKHQCSPVPSQCVSLGLEMTKDLRKHPLSELQHPLCIAPMVDRHRT